MTPPSPHLIDTGPSGFGWSYWGDAFRCVKLFALKRHGGLRDGGEGTVKGSMGHTAEAHRWVRQWPGVEVNSYYPPEEAMARWCDVHPEGTPFLPKMLSVFRTYVAKGLPVLPGTVCGVETLISGALGWKNGEWGLWLDGTEGVTWALLDVPGSMGHGLPVRCTKRLDGLLKAADGHVYIWDHKFISSSVISAAEKYAVDGQWSVVRLLGRQLLGQHYGGVLLNLIGTRDDFQHKLVRVKPAPWRDAQFPTQLWWKANEVARLEAGLGVGVGIHHWPMAQHEQVCETRYGACPAIEMCAKGVG